MHVLTLFPVLKTRATVSRPVGGRPTRRPRPPISRPSAGRRRRRRWSAKTESGGDRGKVESGSERMLPGRKKVYLLDEGLCTVRRRSTNALPTAEVANRKQASRLRRRTRAWEVGTGKNGNDSNLNRSLAEVEHGAHSLSGGSRLKPAGVARRMRARAGPPDRESGLQRRPSVRRRAGPPPQATAPDQQADQDGGRDHLRNDAVRATTSVRRWKRGGRRFARHGPMDYEL